MLYVHIPFCRQACHYCNFHFSTSLKQEEEMIQAMVKEIEFRKDYLASEPLTSIYFGGGTPSLLQDKFLSQIFEAIHAHYTISPQAEVTFEANPEDISLAKLKFWKSVGINRLSIGIQSFHQEDLELMNRIHSVSQSISALDIVDEFGELDYSMDLIFGSDTTSDLIWRKNVEMTIARKPSHISCYALTVEENTALHHFIKQGKRNESPEEKLRGQFYTGRKMLLEAGYDHYEISNYSLPNKNAVHNSNYWKSKNYMGIGPSAHSYNGESRSWNLANNAHYMNAISNIKSAEVKEILSEDDKYNEFIMTRLRTKWGIKKSEIENLFQKQYTDHFEKEIAGLLDSNLIIENSDTFTLSEKALIIADSVSSELFY